MPKPLAILVADLHLSHKRPIARSGEEDWYAAMKRPLDQLADLATEHSVPIFCAGDVFDKWNAPAELINFAIENMPLMYGIPGQHDIPYHNPDDFKRSALFNLVLHDSFRLLKEPTGFQTGGGEVWVHPFQWGQSLHTGQHRKSQPGIRLALIHKYIWKGKKTSYPGAQPASHIKHIRQKLKGFDIAVFGDNHIGFSIKATDTTPTILNCGAFTRRSIDQIDYQPSVGILWDDRTVTRVKLDCTEDKMLSTSKEEVTALEAEFGMEGFITELLALGEDALSFDRSVRHFLDRHNIPDRVRKFVMEALESKSS